MARKKDLTLDEYLAFHGLDRDSFRISEPTAGGETFPTPPSHACVKMNKPLSLSDQARFEVMRHLANLEQQGSMTAADLLAELEEDGHYLEQAEMDFEGDYSQYQLQHMREEWPAVEPEIEPQEASGVSSPEPEEA